MLRHSFFATIVFSLCLVTGCDKAPTHESIAEDSVSLMEEMAAILPTVKDEASANAAKPKLKALAEKAKALKAEEEKLSKLTNEQQAALLKKHEARMTKVFETMIKEGFRISADPKLSSVMDEIKDLK